MLETNRVTEFVQDQASSSLPFPCLQSIESAARLAEATLDSHLVSILFTPGARRSRYDRQTIQPDLERIRG